METSQSSGRGQWWHPPSLSLQGVSEAISIVLCVLIALLFRGLFQIKIEDAAGEELWGSDENMAEGEGTDQSDLEEPDQSDDSSNEGEELMEAENGELTWSFLVSIALFTVLYIMHFVPFNLLVFCAM